MLRLVAWNLDFNANNGKPQSEKGEKGIKSWFYISKLQRLSEKLRNRHKIL
jgi:hypothetical protein